MASRAFDRSSRWVVGGPLLLQLACPSRPLLNGGLTYIPVIYIPPTSHQRKVDLATFTQVGSPLSLSLSSGCQGTAIIDNVLYISRRYVTQGRQASDWHP